MESLIVGLILAAVSAAAFFAYKHPKPYHVLAIIVRIVLIVSYLGMMVWDFGTSHIYVKLLSVIPTEKLAEADKIFHSSKVPDFWYWGVLGFIVYLTALKGLPMLLSYFHEID
jgi:uncharacterized protein YacL